MVSKPEVVRLNRRLLTELDGFQASGDSNLPLSKAVLADQDHVNYQLFFRPEQAKFGNSARVRNDQVLGLTAW